LPLIVGVITLMVLIAQFIVLPKSFFFGIVTLVSAIALIALYLQEQKRFQQENIIDR
jgi:hypothetical protein